MVRKRFRGSMRAMRRLAPLFALLACSGSKAPLTAKTFPAAFAQAVCSVQQVCQGRAGFEEKQCEDDAISLYGTDLDKAIAAGKSAFHADSAQTCVDGLLARGCGRTPPEVDQACEQAVTGTIAAGASCSWIWECAQGRCEPDAPGACPAKCRTVAGEGQSCQDTPCDLRQGLRCIDNVCSKLKGVDAKCGSDSDCQIGLYCDGFSHCSTQVAEQAVCSGQDQCLPGLFCDFGTEGGLCRKQIADSQPCTASSADAIGFACVTGSLCKGFSFAKTGSTSGVCAPIGEIGAPCSASAQVTGCGDGLRCNAGTCADKPTSGPCTSNDDCKDGVAFCNPSSQCQPLIANGGTCQSSDQCASHACDPSSGQCVEAEAACHEP